MGPTLSSYLSIAVGLTLIAFRARWAERVAVSQRKFWGRSGTTDVALLRFLAVVLGALLIAFGIATIVWPIGS